MAKGFDDIKATFTLILIIMLCLTGCDTLAGYETEIMSIADMEISVSAASPATVIITIFTFSSSGCESVKDIEVEREGSTFYVTATKLVGGWFFFGGCTTDERILTHDIIIESVGTGTYTVIAENGKYRSVRKDFVIQELDHYARFDEDR